MIYLVESGELSERIEAPDERTAAVDLVTLASLTGPQALGAMIAVTGDDGDPVYFATCNVQREAFPAA